jgi:exopolyphosphatase/guanosine-5'-triphosphate,3'-diphosphate pyrophosphatase
VGRVHGATVDPVLDRSEFVRLGKDVDATGELRPDRVEAALAAIASLSSVARELGATQILAIATSAVRDARNGPQFARRVREETGIELEIISGEREAQLTFRGATLGMRIEAGTIVCDVGGGSAEVIYADADGVQWSSAEPLGSGRLTERFITHDPPRDEDLSALREGVRDRLRALPSARAATAIFTGGTATQLRRLAREDRNARGLDMGEVDEVVSLVTSRTAAELIRDYNVPEARAQVLPAGLVAIQTIARFYGAERLCVTLHGIREGALLEMGE